MVANPKHILIVDDDPEILDLLASLLAKNAFITHTAEDAASLRKQLNTQENFDLILLDVNLPDGDGVTLSREIAQTHPDTAIMLITANEKEEDHILGLEFGADDYIQKPFNIRTLIARINALLRRRNQGLNASQLSKPPIYTFDQWTLDTNTQALTNEKGVKIPLTKRLYDILVIMLENPNRTLTREHISQAAEARGIETLDRAVDLQISRLRSIIEIKPNQTEIIKTERGFGYMLSAKVSKQ